MTWTSDPTIGDLTLPESLHPSSLLRRAGYLAVWAYFFAVPFEYTITLREPLESFARVLGVLAVVTGFASVMVQGRMRRWRLFHWLVVLYLLLASVSLLWGWAPRDDAGHALREYLQVAPVVLFSWEFVQTSEQRTQIVVAYLAGELITAGMTIRNAVFLHKATYALFRYTVGAWNPNELAIVFAVGLPLALYLALDRSLRLSMFRRSIAWTSLILIPIATLLTGSRTGLIVDCFAFGALLFLVSKSSRSRIVTFLVVFAALVCVALLFVPAGTWRILSTTGTQVQSGDLDLRVKIWRFGWEAFLRSPFFGYGVGSFRWASGTLYNAHNTYLEVSVEQGIAGLLLMLGMMLIALVRLRRAAPSSRIAGTFVLLTWALGATVAHTAELRITWVVFSLAFLFGCDRFIREDRRNSQPSYSHDTKVISCSTFLEDDTEESNWRNDDRSTEG